VFHQNPLMTLGALRIVEVYSSCTLVLIIDQSNHIFSLTAVFKWFHLIKMIAIIKI